MPLKKNMTNAEVSAICKQKPEFEQTYKKCVVIEDHSQVIDMIKRPGSIIEISKQSALGDGMESITVRIICNSKK